MLNILIGIQKMLRNELNIKFLPESMILQYLRNESCEREKMIVEKLITKEYNYENYLTLRDMLRKGEFDNKLPSEKEYEKFNDLVKKHGLIDSDVDSKNRHIKPLAGQIWTTKAIPQLGAYEFEPVAFPKYVYILTNPQPYQLLDNEGYVHNFKDLYTMLVLPISLDAEFATHKDYIIPAGNDPITLEFMIETWLETNMIVCNLEKYVGELTENQIDELLNVYYASNYLGYDQRIYKKASKGKFHDKDYGDIYEFQRIEEENIQYLYEPVNKLYDYLAIDENITKNILDNVLEPVYALAAGDENVLPPEAQRVFASSIIYSDDLYELKFVVLKYGQLYIRLENKAEIIKGCFGKIIIKDKSVGAELQTSENINLAKAINYVKLNKRLNNRLIEFSFIKENKLYFLKNMDFRDVGYKNEN